MTAPVERFVAALDKYVDAKIVASRDDSKLSAVQRSMSVTAAKTTMTNELRLLLASAQEDTRTAAQRAAAWRK